MFAVRDAVVRAGVVDGVLWLDKCRAEDIRMDGRQPPTVARCSHSTPQPCTWLCCGCMLCIGILSSVGDCRLPFAACLCMQLPGCCTARPLRTVVACELQASLCLVAASCRDSPHFSCPRAVAVHRSGCSTSRSCSVQTGASLQWRWSGRLTRRQHPCDTSLTWVRPWALYSTRVSSMALL
jgi:hypothetical protein